MHSASGRNKKKISVQYFLVERNHWHCIRHLFFVRCNSFYFNSCCFYFTILFLKTFSIILLSGDQSMASKYIEFFLIFEKSSKSCFFVSPMCSMNFHFNLSSKKGGFCEVVAQWLVYHSIPPSRSEHAPLTPLAERMLIQCTIL